MSIATALTALNADVEAAKAAIENKGGTAPDGTADMADAIAAIPSGGITPSGKKLITDTSETDVAAFATAQISSDTLLAENIKKNVNILGVVGSFEGGGATITDGIVVTSRNANGEPLAVDIYGTIIYKYTLGSGVGRSYGFPLWTVTSCRFVDQVVEIKDDAFRLTGLSSVELPISVVTMGANVFRQSDLKTIKAPFSFNYSGSQGLYCFYDCNKLESVELGSAENSVKITQSQLFRTSGAFTVTVWAIGSTIDTTIANIHSGAPNATIIIKASEDTTYGGETYLTGETIITSTPT